MMKRTQLYIPQDVHNTLSFFAKIHGWTLSHAVRKALEEFIEKPKVKKVIIKNKKIAKKKSPFADIVGMISSGDPNLSKNIDEIYDED